MSNEKILKLSENLFTQIANVNENLKTFSKLRSNEEHLNSLYRVNDIGNCFGKHD